MKNKTWGGSGGRVEEILVVKRGTRRREGEQMRKRLRNRGLYEEKRSMRTSGGRGREEKHALEKQRRTRRTRNTGF